MLVGLDRDQILQKRFQAANWQVLTVGDPQSAVNHARHELFNVAVVISRGSLINLAEMIFNLRDINRSMEIVIVVDRLGNHASRPLRQLIEHPVERTRFSRGDNCESRFISCSHKRHQEQFSNQIGRLGAPCKTLWTLPRPRFILD
jgi:hypothetical protein